MPVFELTGNAACDEVGWGEVVRVVVARATPPAQTEIESLLLRAAADALRAARDHEAWVRLTDALATDIGADDPAALGSWVVGDSGPLVVTQLVYGSVPVERVRAGDAPALELLATADGGPADLSDWHTGPSIAEDHIAFERHVGDRCAWRGTIHRTSRVLLTAQQP